AERASCDVLPHPGRQVFDSSPHNGQGKANEGALTAFVRSEPMPEGPWFAVPSSIIAQEPGREVVEGNAEPALRSPENSTENWPRQVPQLFTGGLPFDVRALELGVEAFFAHLGSLAEELAGFESRPGLIPWVVTVAAATTAFEIARRRQKKHASCRLALETGR